MIWRPGADSHGVAFYDDWGTQNGLFLSPQMWTELFLPRYKAQFNRVHAHGMDVYFHSCGQITPIIGGLFDAGVDMLNLSQPNLYDMEALGREGTAAGAALSFR